MIEYKTNDHLEVRTLNSRVMLDRHPASGTVVLLLAASIFQIATAIVILIRLLT